MLRQKKPRFAEASMFQQTNDGEVVDINLFGVIVTFIFFGDGGAGGDEPGYPDMHELLGCDVSGAF